MQTPRKAWPRLMAGMLLGVVLFAGPAFLFSASPQKLTVFWQRGSYQVDIADISGKPYVDLASLLQPMQATSTQLDGKKFKVNFGGERAEFQDGKKDGKIGRYNLHLGETFVLQGDRGMVSLRLVPDLLPYFTGERVDYHPVSQRLFIGSSAKRFSVELKKSPPALVLTFSGRVDPEVHTESGRVRLEFLRDGLSASEEGWKFHDSVITSAGYSEGTLGPEIAVTATEPLMATFSEGGRVITIAVAPGVTHGQAATAAPPPAVPAPAMPAATAAPPAETPATAIPGTAQVVATSPPIIAVPHARFLVIVDAAHGGDERGAALTASLAEKDVTLALARRLRAELESRGVVTYLLRDSDATIPADQRAMAVNAAHAAIYVAIHAGTLGRGVRIYTTMISPASGAAGAFLPWETAQAGYVRESRLVAGEIVEAMDKAPPDFPVSMMPAPVRPLNNIAGPALAVEVSPLNRNAESLANVAYQQKVAVALAAAIAAVRPQETAP
jgi:N-acetylmuramoyl-L-alanine amidase